MNVKRTHKACKACYVVLKIVLSLSLKTGRDLSPINCAGWLIRSLDAPESPPTNQTHSGNRFAVISSLLLLSQGDAGDNGMMGATGTPGAQVIFSDLAFVMTRVIMNWAKGFMNYRKAD